MTDISRALETLKEDFESADNLVSEIYQKYFAQYFSKEEEMYQKFQDAKDPITDKELEWIITSLPLNLFAATNALAQFKQHNEIVKLKIKQRKTQGDGDTSLDDEYKLMQIIYSSVITRVEQEMSFSKEMIMGAKKVWDTRRLGETPVISEVVPKKPDLPDYNFTIPSDTKF